MPKQAKPAAAVAELETPVVETPPDKAAPAAAAPAKPEKPEKPAAATAEPEAKAGEEATTEPTIIEPETDFADEMRNSLLGLPAEDKPKDVKDAKPAEAAKAAVTAAAPEKPAAGPKLKITREEAKAGMSPEEVAQIAAQTVAEFRRTEPKPEAAKPEEEAIPEELKAHAPDYAQLEKLFPNKYKPGLVKRVAGFKQAEIAYADKWEAANTGETFNADAPEHEEFYTKNQPQIDPADLEEARFERRYQQRFARDVTPELDAVKLERAMTKAEPVAKSAAGAVGIKIFKALNENHEGELTPEAIKAWAEAEPLAAKASQTVAEEFLPVAHTASLLWDGVLKLDPTKPVHKSAQTMFVQMETELAAASPAELTNPAGQKWIPLAKFNAMPEAQRARFYTTTREALVNYIGLIAAEKARKMTEEVTAEEQTRAEYYAKKFGYVKAQDPNPAPAKAAETVETPATVRSPSVGGGTPTGPSKGAASVVAPAAPSIMDGLLGLTQLGG